MQLGRQMYEFFFILGFICYLEVSLAFVVYAMFCSTRNFTLKSSARQWLGSTTIVSTYVDTLYIVLIC